MRYPRHLRALTACLSLTVSLGVLACSSDSDTAGNEVPATGSQKYHGLLTGPSESGTIDIVVGGAEAKPTARRDAHPLAGGQGPNVTGTITLTAGGVTISLTGSYDAATGVLSLAGSTSGGHYALTGAATADGFSGTYEGPSGSGSFTLASSASGQAKLYCGTAVTSGGDEAIVWNLVVGDNGNTTGAYCNVSECGALSGRVEGGTLTLSDPNDATTTATGTIAGEAASGSWSTSGGAKGGSWSGSSAACEPSQGGAGGSGGGGAGGAGSGGGGPGGAGGGGAVAETLLANVNEPVSLAMDASYFYWLSAAGAVIQRCALPACASAETVTDALSVPSSVAVSNGTVYWTSGFSAVMSCAAPASGATCTGTSFADVGASSYPAHLSVANGHIYWISEAGPTRRIQTCPTSGCASGYPKTVFQSESGALLDGAAISGFAVDSTHAYVAVFTGGIYGVSLTDPETATAASVTKLQDSAYGTSELDVDGTTLRWGVTTEGRVQQCTAPACTSVSDYVTGRQSPVGTRSSATAVLGVDRGVASGSAFTPNTGSVWRVTK